MRYKGSVEDRVHELLSSRLGEIKSMFGQIPDYLDDVWIKVALNEIEPVRWEECSIVLDSTQRRRHLMAGW